VEQVEEEKEIKRARRKLERRPRGGSAVRRRGELLPKENRTMVIERW